MKQVIKCFVQYSSKSKQNDTTKYSQEMSDVIYELAVLIYYFCKYGLTNGD